MSAKMPKGWFKWYVLFPHKTIGGKRIRGKCYVRYVQDQYQTYWYKEYATDEEVFAEKLKGNN